MEVKQMAKSKGTQGLMLTKVWFFDEIFRTTDSEDMVREKMLENGYIEGIEFGFNMADFLAQAL